MKFISTKLRGVPFCKRKQRSGQSAFLKFGEFFTAIFFQICLQFYHSEVKKFLPKNLGVTEFGPHTNSKLTQALFAVPLKSNLVTANTIPIAMGM